MSTTNCLSNEQTEGFDCSTYLGHGLKWPAKQCLYAVDTRYYCGGSKQCNKYSSDAGDTPNPIIDWKSMPFEETNRGLGTKGSSSKFLEENYYKSEYNTLLQWIDEEEVIIPPASQFADKREEIHNISLLAEEAWSSEYHNMNLIRNGPQYCSSSCKELAKEVVIKAIEKPRDDSRSFVSSCENLSTEVAIKAIETPRETISPGGFQNFVAEQLKGFGVSSEKSARHNGISGGFQIFIEKQLDGFGDFTKKSHEGVFRKRRLCRHFVKGFCQRGDSCDFLHDASIFCSDDQKVFLGGLPLHLTSGLLKTKLEENGLTVLNNPRIMRGFSREVCLGSIEEAEKLVAVGHIYIGEHRVDVRAFQDKNKLRQVVPSASKRSVFLGGLPVDTTGDMIINDLQRLDIKVVDLPVVKDGYAPRVVLSSVENAKMLVALKRVMINGTAVDVRPYVNFRKRY